MAFIGVQDAYEYCKKCDVCQRIGKLLWRDELPLFLVTTLEPFEKWEIDFVASINPPTWRMSAHYITTMMEYLTCWAEATPVKDFTSKTTTHLIFKNIVAWFGYPRVLMSDQSTHFLNSTLK